jgi:thiol-disulfide isomerase/thioredoxin
VCVLQGGASPCKPGVARAIRSGVCYAFFFVTLSLFVNPSYALQYEQAKEIPHVDYDAKRSFKQYIHASESKAFAIAPGGAWAWIDYAENDETAKRVAIEKCREQTQLQCIIYALNNKIVFDKKKWATLWRLSKFEKDTASPFGVSRASYFPNLVFKDQNGKTHRISDSKGKVTFVHFWGSWCPPCLREMPELLRLQKGLKKELGDKVKMILLQVREPFSESLLWAKQNKFNKLPLYDSVPSGENNDILETASGKKLYDRMIARVFPSTYVLDKKGRVLFTHRGPVSDWSEYLAFFKDVAK